MGLLRTPPQKASTAVPGSASQPDAGPSDAAQPVEAASPTHTVANTTLSTLPSPSRAFAPRRPGVMRSPPPGATTTGSPSTLSVYPNLPPAASESRVDNEEVSMDIDEPSLDLAGTPIRDPTLSFAPITPAQISVRSIPPSAATAIATPGPAQPANDQSIQGDMPTQAGPSRSATSAPTPAQEPGSTEEEMDSDDDDISLSDIPAAPVTPGPTRTRRSSHLQPAPADSPIVPQAQASSSAFVTPKPSRGTKTARSTRQSAAAAADPAPNTETQVGPAAGDMEMNSKVDEKEYGRRWKMTKETIQLASDRVISKWTLRDLRKALPTLAARDVKEFEKHYEHAANQLRAGILREADKILEHYKVDKSLQLMDQVISEGETYESQRKSDAGRIDAWRPDLTPAALTAATVLPIYDEAWDRLRVEYLELYDDARKRYASISVKQAQLKELEESVADGVIELDQTIKVLDGFPNEEMMGWTEDVAGRLAGYRDP